MSICRGLRGQALALMLFVGLLLIGFQPFAANAQEEVSAAGLPFNHMSTGFMLTGSHMTTRCESCHTQGNFKGTPRECSSCHRTGDRASGKSVSHIPTQAVCDTCHRTTTWSPSTFKHTAQMAGQCTTCHSGTFVNSGALAKPLTHINTTASCDTCHATKAWLPATNPHAGVQPGTCVTCHNGTRAPGKSSGHIPVSGSCDTCHTNFVSFAPAKMDHTGLSACSTCHGGAFVAVNAQSKPATHIAVPSGQECSFCHASTTSWAVNTKPDHAAPGFSTDCQSCHRGAAGGAIGKPARHIPGAGQCSTCHNTSAFKPAQMDHTGLSDCASCHNGSFVFANAQAKRVGHVPTTAQCSVCHSSGFSVWTGARMTHDNSVVGKCASCHGGGFLAVNAQSKTPTHIPTTAQCDTCHKSTATWATGSFAHTSAVLGQCSSCHNGRNALGKPTNHIPTSAQCDSCHNNFTAFRPAAMSHAGLNGQCSTCHNGSYQYVNALSKPASHIPTTAQCDTCHTNGFVTWMPAAMNHAGFVNNCSTCHSGTYVAQNAQIKPLTHVTTTAQCDTCHRSTTTWASAVYSHDASAANNCSTCHDGQVALGKSTRHVPVTAQCDVCHSNFSAFAPARMDHQNGRGGQTCATCHNGTFPTALGKPVTHIPTSRGCDTCHTTSVWKPATAWVHANSNPPCATCHDGVQALGKSVRHVPTSRDCNACHSNSGAVPSFTPARMDHTNETACSTCHNGSFLIQNAQAKPATHVAYTPQECSACHTSRTSWATTTGFPHESVSPAATGRCSDCHTAGVRSSGTVSQGLSKPTNHIPTTLQCDTCHLNTTAFAPANMNHAGTAGKCATCHNGSFVFANAQTKSINHVVTSAPCDTCHKSTTAWSAAQYVHAADSAGRCATCHDGGSPIALTRPATHIPTAGAANCDNCHTNFTTFAPARMNHTGLTSSCLTCHGGSYVAINAQKASASHIPVSGIACDACHVNGYVSWTPSSMNHSVLGARCDSCHNGNYLAQNAQSRGVNHVPVLPLGADCNSCHTSTAGVTWAIFGKPLNHDANVNNCTTCHSNLANSPAIGKPVTHVPTNAQCDSCHNTTLFRPAAMSHKGTNGQCLTCHNGAYAGVNAKGKPATHIPVSQVCDTCHTTTAWKPASNFSHQGVTAASCANCHNGVNALGKPAKHIPVTAVCDSCHKNYVAFIPAQMNHTGLTNQCSTCHSGAYLTINAQTKPVTHVATIAQCDTCHKSTTTWATVSFAHGPTDTVCSSCHNGKNALGKPVNHIPTADQCSTCHTNKIAFSPAQMTHASPATNIVGNCASCHNGNFVFANALAKPATHIPVTGQCDTCHTNTVRWSPSQMTHTGLTASCVTCHGGAYVAQNAQMKPAGHIVASNDCTAIGCHTNALTTKSWATSAKPDHNTVVGTCVSCHDGAPLHAIGKPTNHVPSSSSCGLCHSESAPNFTLTVMPHTINLVGGECAKCHNGGYTFTGAQAKTGTHIPTTQSCDVCHAYPNWKPTSFNHTGITGNCSSCHNGTNAAGKPATHIPTLAMDCNACHLTGANGINWLPLKPLITHTGTSGTCASCHVRPYTSIKAMEDTNHIPVTLPGMLGRECSFCHSSYTTFMTQKMNHGNVTVCKNCHDTAAPAYDAPGIEKKSVTHDKKTGTDCNNANCHKPGVGGRGTLYSKW